MAPIFQKTVSNLPLGWAWLDWGHSIYGEIKFPPYLPKKHVISALSNQEESVENE